MSCIGARRFTSSALSICSWVKSSTAPLAGSAALATSASTAPARSARASAAPGSARSAASTSARPPTPARISSSASSRLPFSSPARRVHRAHARWRAPIPDAPVSRTVEPAGCRAPTLPRRIASGPVPIQRGAVLIEHEGVGPRVAGSAYVAPNAVLCGDSCAGEEARILFGAVLTAEGGASRSAPAR